MLLSIMSQTIIGNNILPSEMSSVELLCDRSFRRKHAYIPNNEYTSYLNCYSWYDEWDDVYLKNYIQYL